MSSTSPKPKVEHTHTIYFDAALPLFPNGIVRGTVTDGDPSWVAVLVDYEGTPRKFFFQTTHILVMEDVTYQHEEEEEDSE